MSKENSQNPGFFQGEIVKSNSRTEKSELFLLVLFDPDPVPFQFKAAVLKDFAGIEQVGLVYNNWNTEKFTISSLRELGLIAQKGEVVES